MDTSITNVIISVVLSSITALLTTLWLNYSKKKDETNSLKLALKTELQTIQTLYYQLKLSNEPPKNGDDIKVISLKSKYTTVYTNNADKIGLLNPEVAKAVVLAYTYVSAFIDTLRVHRQRWEDMIKYQRTGQNQYMEYYLKDVKRCYDFAMTEEEIVRGDIAKAIDKLN